MQTPAPFEYERATSVEGAIASLERLGPEARIIAGGHSLLPMMKLRLANPEHLIDINDLDRALLHPRGGRRDPDRRADPARRAAEVRAARRALPALPRRRERDRRPGRAQPRHDRRLALPGRRGRGPLGRLLGGQGAGRDPRRRAASGWSAMEDFHVGPVHDRGRRRRDAHRGAPRRCAPAPAARTRRSSAAPATGRSPPRRRRSGSTAARSPTPASRSARSGSRPSTSPAPRSCCAARRRREELFAQAGEIASADCSPMRRRPRAGRLQAPPRRRPHPPGAAPRRRRAPCARRPDHERLDDGQRRAGLARDRAAPAARALHPRDARPDRHPLGLRHLELRRLRRADRRRAGQVVHDPRGDVRGPRDPHGRVARGRRRARPGPAGLPRAARAPVRLLHAGDADDRRARCSTRTPTRPSTRSGPRSPGAICRCTGYKNIVSAVRWAAEHEAAAKQEA